MVEPCIILMLPRPYIMIKAISHAVRAGQVITTSLAKQFTDPQISFYNETWKTWHRRVIYKLIDFNAIMIRKHPSKPREKNRSLWLHNC